MDEYYNRYLRWKSEATNPDMVFELEKMKDNDGEIRHRFSEPLAFGTAGLRGVMTAGINAVNVYTIAQATQGLSDYIIEFSGKDALSRGVVIAFDSRINSALFAKTAAETISSSGIHVYLFDSPRPTPLLSYAIRKLGCISGINVTASHNPKEYNGYKVYWEDGAQISPACAAAISEKIAARDIFTQTAKSVSPSEIVVLGSDFDEYYIAEVLKETVRHIGLCGGGPKVVYTPLFGTGSRIIPETLRRAGLCELIIVESQSAPDGNFPGLKFPNPEFSEVFAEGIKVAKQYGSDLVIATDPDADRVGIMTRSKSGKFINLSGNQIGALLLEYVLSAYTDTNTMPPNPFAVKTIVSTELAAKICAHHNVKLYDVLTGFKYIGEVIKNSEENGDGSFVFGFEESNGYLKGSYARDKDAVVASLLICEAAAYYATREMTLSDALDEIYEKYGYFSEKLENIIMEGIDGSERMKRVMAQIRENPPREIAGFAIESHRDYKTGLITHSDGSISETGLPKSDVLYFRLTDGDSVIVRPSGTEPKVKVYCLAHGNSAAAAEDKADMLKNAAKQLIAE